MSDKATPVLAALRRGGAALLTAALVLAAGCTNLPSASPFKGAELSVTPLIGKFVWRDLVTENPDAVKPFYADLFGWEFEEVRALGAPYTLIKSGGHYIADLFSDITVAPRLVLRDRSGHILMQLEAGSTQPLLDAGWKLPVPFKVGQIAKAGHL